MTELKSECKDLNKLVSAVKIWSAERNIDKLNPVMQMLKLGEEVGELNKAMLKRDADGIVDAIGDTVVSLVTLCQQLNLELVDCVDTAYGEIKNRQGEVVAGVYVKEETT